MQTRAAMEIPPSHIEILKKRILSRVVVDKRGCWIWQGYKLPSGYGKMSYAGHRAKFTHRVSFAAFVGPIPAKMWICHRCDNPPCVNPTHLFLGSPSENANDMVSKMRSYVAFEKVKTNCNRGHELSGHNLIRHSNGRRQCRKCARISGARYYQKKKRKQ